MGFKHICLHLWEQQPDMLSVSDWMEAVQKLCKITGIHVNDLAQSWPSFIDCIVFGCKAGKQQRHWKGIQWRKIHKQSNSRRDFKQSPKNSLITTNSLINLYLPHLCIVFLNSYGLLQTLQVHSPSPITDLASLLICLQSDKSPDCFCVFNVTMLPKRQKNITPVVQEQVYPVTL